MMEKQQQVPEDIQQSATDHVKRKFSLLIPADDLSDDRPVESNVGECKEFCRNDYISGRLEERAGKEQEAIEFAEWLPSHAQPRSINKNWMYNWKNSLGGVSQVEKTTKELYKRRYLCTKLRYPYTSRNNLYRYLRRCIQKQRCLMLIRQT